MFSEHLLSTYDMYITLFTAIAYNCKPLKHSKEVDVLISYEHCNKLYELGELPRWH